MQDVSNHLKENLPGVAIRCGQDQPDEYGKLVGQDVKQGVAHHTPIFQTGEIPVHSSIFAYIKRFYRFPLSAHFPTAFEKTPGKKLSFALFESFFEILAA